MILSNRVYYKWSFKHTVETMKDNGNIGDANCTAQYIISNLNTKFCNLEGAGMGNQTSSFSPQNNKKKFNKLKSQVNSEKNASNINSSHSLAGKKGNTGKKKIKLKIWKWQIKFDGITKTINGEKKVLCE